MTTHYSVCTTSYNSASTVKGFLEPFLALGREFEVVVVDNESRDNTFELLQKHSPKVKSISKKCTRGKGRQTAMDASSGEITIHVEFDVGYLGVMKAIEHFENSDKGKIYYFIIEGQKCNASLYIGRRDLYYKVGGFPDLNYAEDLYFNKKALASNLLSIVHIPLELDCLEVRGMSSGAEARYEKSRYKQFTRRVIATRDILFVNEIGYRELMIKYKLNGVRAIVIGIPEYVLGRMLRFTIKEPPLNLT